MNLNFAENFKNLRKEKGITQEKIADILGVSSQSISRWELCICYPDIEMLPSIANYFGVTVDYLLSNDLHSKEKDRALFWEKLDEFPIQQPKLSILLTNIAKNILRMIVTLFN